nr:MAG TPA: Protein of unknown function (DUF3255) [Caudoviricetes sp.]
MPWKCYGVISQNADIRRSARTTNKNRFSNLYLV